MFINDQLLEITKYIFEDKTTYKILKMFNKKLAKNFIGKNFYKVKNLLKKSISENIKKVLRNGMIVNGEVWNE